MKKVKLSPTQVTIEATPDKPVDVSTPSNKSAAIFQALLALGDPNAPASKVKEYVIEHWPRFRKIVESERHWDNYVTQCRERAARKLGLPRNLRPGRRPKAGTLVSAAAGQRITIADLLELTQIRSKLKNEGDLVEVVQLVLKLGPEPRLRKMLDKYTELAKRHAGDGGKVERYLQEARELGLNWDG